MSDETLAQRLRRQEGERRNKTMNAIERLDEEESSSASAEVKPLKKKKPKKPESVGTGKPSFDIDAFIAKTNAQIAATSDPRLIEKLKARQKAVLDNQ